jgi:hypothetical protein
VLLLAGHFTGMATRAKVIVNEQSGFCHVYFSPSIIFSRVTKVVLYCPPPKPELLP